MSDRIDVDTTDRSYSPNGISPVPRTVITEIPSLVGPGSNSTDARNRSGTSRSTGIVLPRSPPPAETRSVPPHE